MTKKDYIKFARMCADLRQYASIYNQAGNAVVEMRELEYRLANVLELDNPRFDREKFLSACGGR